MAIIVPTNFARATVSSPPSGTSGLIFTVAAGKGALFPSPGAGEYFYGVFTNAARTAYEVVKVESRSTDSFTIATSGRGQDSSSAATWNTGDIFFLPETRKSLQETSYSAASLAIAGTTPAADKLPYFTSGTAATTTTLTSFARTLLEDADGPAACTTLGAISGTIIDAKGDIIVGTAADTPARKAVGSNGQIIVADSTQSDGLIWTDFSKDPLNVNPNMLLDQINEGALYTVNTTSVQGPDGWTGNAAGGGVFKLRRIADPDNAARYVTEITCTTADAAIGATDKYEIYTAIEGYDLAQLAPGTASAGKITVQFQFKTNVTGTYCIALQNSAQDRAYIGTVVVSDTSVHDYSVTLTLDTSGTWLYTNGVGAFIFFGLAVGSNFQASGGSWQAGNYHATSAQVNFMSSNTNVAYLGRFHVIPGNVVCAYKPADIQRELAKAQRYYRKTYAQGTAVGTATGTGRFLAGVFGTGTSPAWNWRFDMRASPTTTSYSYASGTSGKACDTAGTDQNATIDNVGPSGVSIYISAGSLEAISGHATVNARLS